MQPAARTAASRRVLVRWSSWDAAAVRQGIEDLLVVSRVADRPALFVSIHRREERESRPHAGFPRGDVEIVP